MPEIVESVINHLLFHRSLIDEEDSGDRITTYLEMVKQLQEGTYIAIEDPFEKSIAMVFELVIEHQLNPWDIDLIKFSKMYLKRLDKEKDINFITAGRLVFMAWSVLKMQSDALLANATPSGQSTEICESIPKSFYQTPEDFDYTTTVLNSSEPPIQESVWRKGARPVTLMELIEAFNEAKREAELQLQINAIREKQRKIYTDTKFHEKVHGENLQEDIKSAWKRILSFNGAPIPLSQLHNGSREDLITTLISILFLVQMKKIKLWQRNLPYGEIFIQNIELAKARTPAEEGNIIGKALEGIAV